MIIEYQLDENDYLIHQLYIASKSARIRKKRFKNRLIVAVIYFISGILLLFLDIKIITPIVFIVIALLWYFVYPLYEKKHYIKHYKAFIKENYSKRIEKHSKVTIENDLIIVLDDKSEGKISTKEIEQIIEIPPLILIKFKTGQSLLFPKNRIENKDDIIIRLNELAVYLNVSYSIENNWTWK